MKETINSGELIAQFLSWIFTIWVETTIAYYIIKNKIKKETEQKKITNFNELLLNMNNKINNIEKEIKEMKKE